MATITKPGQRTRAPFRADMVGSLLRTARLKQAREQHAKGEIKDQALAAIEDEEIRKLVKRQEDIGLQAVTDGEFRRSFWHFDFLEQLDGVEGYTPEHGIKFQGIETRAKGLKVLGKVGFSGHPMIGHFRFLKSVTSRVPKMTIPSPSMLHYRTGRGVFGPGLYLDMNEFYRDLGAAYSKVVAAFAEAGCRYLQLDDTSFAYLCDPEQRKMLSDRGDDPAKQPGIYGDIINQAIRNRPKDMVITMHLCRGNFRSTFVSSGGYEPVAELLFNAIDVDGYFMEWDNERSGGFEPLRFLPAGKTVVLGLVTTKTGSLESKDDLKRRIDEAARFTSLDRLCLSPQCGFASTEEGNVLAEDEQWRKLERVVEVSREVWG